jgi:hypothetical protein
LVPAGDREIRSRIDALLTDISQLVKRSAFEAVSAALGGDGLAMSAAAPKRGPGRPGKPAARAAVRAPAARRGKRERRTSDDVIATANTFLTYVKANDGQRLEESGKGRSAAPNCDAPTDRS